MKRAMYLAAPAVFTLALAAVGCAAGKVAAKAPAPTPLFLDTDVCVDAGNVAAITCLNGLADRGEAKILGITCVTSCPYAQDASMPCVAGAIAPMSPSAH